MNSKKIFLWSALPLISAPVILISSCSNSEQMQREKLTKMIDQFLKDKLQLINKKPSEIQVDDLLKNLKASQTFGFALSSNIDERKDDLGQLNLTINFTRGKQNFQQQYQFDNLKTTDQEANDVEIKPEEFFNFSPNKDNQFIELNASDATKDQSITTLVNQLNEAEDPIDKLKEIISIEPSNLLKENNKISSLLKKKLDSNFTLRFSTFKTIDLFGIPNGIRTRVQIIKKDDQDQADKISSAFVLNIVGFTSPIEKFRTTNFLNNYIDNFFDSFASPIRIEFQNEYLSQPASEIKTTELLSLLLSSTGEKTQLNGAEVTFKLLNLIDKSQDDQTGSLRAEFEFQIKGSISVPDPVPPLEIGKPIRKVVTLFGFKIKAD